MSAFTVTQLPLPSLPDSGGDDGSDGAAMGNALDAADDAADSSGDGRHVAIGLSAGRAIAGRIKARENALGAWINLSTLRRGSGRIDGNPEDSERRLAAGVYTAPEMQTVWLASKRGIHANNLKLQGIDVDLTCRDIILDLDLPNGRKNRATHRHVHSCAYATSATGPWMRSDMSARKDSWSPTQPFFTRKLSYRSLASLLPKASVPYLELPAIFAVTFLLGFVVRIFFAGTTHSA
ncbi:hypothetical protein B0H14DRAFT_2590011 [Mycena olivaceomarginata]|nr:hypothetical protein B0H14DRAFT_2590011 [Mycena olivaceomarginata]